MSNRPRAGGLVCIAALAVSLATLVGSVWAQVTPDSLLGVTNLRAVPKMNSDRSSFIVYLLWNERPTDGVSLPKINHPDTTGWNPTTSSSPQSALAVPSAFGLNMSEIDRTITFLALDNGTIGVTPQIRLRYEIVKEEEWSGELDLGTNSGYAVGDTVILEFENTEQGSPDFGRVIDLGLRMSFGPGLTDSRIDSNGVMLVGLENVEGFHMWRGEKPDGSDLVNIGEVSREAAFLGIGEVQLDEPGFQKVMTDSVYFNEFIPALRRTGGTYRFEPPPPGIPQKFTLSEVLPDLFAPGDSLGANEFIWFDINAFNGFTYDFAVTTFDRGYSVRSSSQGLTKYDSCEPELFEPFTCDTLVSVTTKVSPQADLQRVYAVPNPYRSGGSQFTTQNYHNYPDNKMRFVNVPEVCVFKIYTPAGDLVWETEHDAANGIIEWDTRNQAGEPVSSGIYVYKLEDQKGKGVYGRIVIIR